MSLNTGLTPEKMDEYREAFGMFDKDGNGSICAQELREVMQSLGSSPSMAELNDIISEVDVDGNGTIDFDEFVIMMQRQSGQMSISEPQLRKIFAHADKDHDGFVNESELYECIVQLQFKLDDSKVRRLVTKVAEECRNQVALSNVRNLVVQLLTIVNEDEELWSAFKVFDKDGNKEITLSELRQVMEGLGEDLSEKEMVDMFNEADVNGDKVINFEEFKAMMKK